MRKRRKSWIRLILENPKVEKISGILLPVLLGIGFFILWQTQLLHLLLRTDTFTLPLPTRILSIISENIPKIVENVGATVMVAILGLVAGSLIGYLIAVIATIFPKWGMGGLSIVAAFNAIPIVALAPVMTNWTKEVSKDANIRSMVAKILVVMIVCIASMSMNAYRGLNELKPYTLDLLDSYAAKPFIVFSKLRMPNSIPYVFIALRVSVPGSVIAALVSEYFAEVIIGVGRQIRENIVLSQYATAWAYITVACGIGIVMYGVLMFVEKILLKHKVNG